MSEMNRLRMMFALLMSCLMSLLMTGWVTWINVGIGSRFMAQWSHAFLMAWPAAFVIVVIAAPTMQRLSKRLLDACTRSTGPTTGHQANQNTPAA